MDCYGVCFGGCVFFWVFGVYGVVCGVGVFGCLLLLLVLVLSLLCGFGLVYLLGLWFFWSGGLFVVCFVFF
ncbi:hypothetical protein ACPTKF_13520, partial [Enterococcus faecium]